MNPHDVFVERGVVLQKLVTPEQLQRAKTLLASHTGKPLLDVLLELGFIKEQDARSLQQMYERASARGGLAAASRAAEKSAPASNPSAPAPSAGVRAAPPQLPSTTLPPADAERMAAFCHLDEFLGYTREVGASDLHVTPGSPPIIRRFGRLVALPRRPFTAAETEGLLFGILSDPQKNRVLDDKALDFCHVVPAQGRYRSCIVKQRLGWDGAFRVIQYRVPTFEELGLPPALERVTEYAQGLVLVTGPVGCGKSTTLAAMIELINQQREEHIITIEDPVEFHFVPAKSHISQREVGVHTQGFAVALRAALREDPDVIMIGELRDLETVSLAITAAETGHLVFGTLHTTSAARTIDRILDVFPPDEQPQIRNMISESIRGIVCQQLLPRKDGTGRALALEIMFNTSAVANMIRERKLFQMPSVLQTSRKQGMVPLDHSLMELVNADIIDGTEAYFAADNKAPFAKWAPKADGVAPGA